MGERVWTNQKRITCPTHCLLLSHPSFPITRYFSKDPEKYKKSTKLWKNKNSSESTTFFFGLLHKSSGMYMKHCEFKIVLIWRSNSLLLTTPMKRKGLQYMLLTPVQFIDYQISGSSFQQLLFNLFFHYQHFFFLVGSEIQMRYFDNLEFQQVTDNYEVVYSKVIRRNFSES